MKKFGFFLFAVLGLIACGDDNNDPTPEQHVTCSISAPAEGAMVNIAEKMTIKGEATIDSGEISNVTLKVGGKAISEVTAVPFSYDYTFEANQAEGALKIELTVKGDQGTMATSEVNITLTKPEPTPEPGEGEMVDSRDNHVYKTVEIGEQTWMAENLAYLPKVNKPAAAATCEGEPLYFVYDYDGEDVNAAKNTETYKTYGVLYNWYAAMNKENEEGNWEEQQDWANFAYVPFILTLRDKAGKAIYHWENKLVKDGNSYEHNASNCRWVTGEGSWGDAWFCWYEGNRKNESGLGGWQTNKQIIGYYRGGLPICLTRPVEENLSICLISPDIWNYK